MVKKLYPFTSHYLPINGHRCHYLEEGQGEPVVMVHGNPTWSFYYRNLVLALRNEYRTIVPDHIGCGLSDKPDDAHYSYTLSRRVDDLEALLEQLGVRENLTLVVHDWGGMIGMAYACRHPECIRRLVVFNTAAFHLPSKKAFPWPLWICRDTPIGSILVRGLNAFSLVASEVGCKTRPLSKTARRGYLAPYDSWNHRIAIHRFVQDIPLRPNDRSYALVSHVEANLHKLKEVPLLICWGLRDFVFDHHFLEEWSRRFPDGEVHAFAKAGHYVLEDAEKDILPLVKNFLKKHPLPVAGQ
jgi:haloalkane dehalogenase